MPLTPAEKQARYRARQKEARRDQRRAALLEAADRLERVKPAKRKSRDTALEQGTKSGTEAALLFAVAFLRGMANES